MCAGGYSRLGIVLGLINICVGVLSSFSGDKQRWTGDSLTLELQGYMPTGGTTSPNSTVRTGHGPGQILLAIAFPKHFLLAVHAPCCELNGDLGTDHQPPERLSITQIRLAN